jgi:hypothetical protein
MRPNRALLLALAIAPSAAQAQDAYKVEVLKESAPAVLSAPVKEAMNAQGYRVLDANGKPVVDFWLRKAVPASGKPAGPQGAVLFPVLEEGELLGALRFPAEGHDYRDQPIAAGVYTLRYGLQPVNGDHLGVSPFRDFALLLPSGKDQTTAVLKKKPLEEQSAAAAGTSHPAVLMLFAPPEGAATAPAMAHDQEKDTWGAIVPLPLSIKGESAPTALPIQLVVAGVATS